MAQILVFGDNIVYGFCDKESGWVGRLRKFVDNKPNAFDQEKYCLVYNLGISGDSSKWLAERFDFEIKQRLREGDETVFIFEVGLNDSSFVKDKNILVSPEKFRRNIQKIITLAKNYSPNIFLIGLFPVDETKTRPWITGKSYRNEYLHQYNEIIKSVCAENKIRFIDIYGKFAKTDYKNRNCLADLPNFSRVFIDYISSV